MNETNENVILEIEDRIERIYYNPDMIALIKKINQTKDVIQNTLKEFRDKISTYHQSFINVIEKVSPALQQIAKAINKAALAYYLGEMQFVWWKIPPMDIIKMVSDETNEKNKKKILFDWIKTYNPYEIIEIIKTKKYLHNNSLLLQTLNAYDRKDYSIAIIGLTACFDYILSVCSRLSTQKIEKRVEELVDRFEKIEDNSLSHDEYNDFYLIITYQMTINSFSEFAHFDEDEPVGINRHWIMHGRMEKEVTQVDCIKIINLIYGTIIIAEMTEE